MNHLCTSDFLKYTEENIPVLGLHKPLYLTNGIAHILYLA